MDSLKVCGCFAIALADAVRSLKVVVQVLLIQINLQSLLILVNFFAECNGIKLILLDPVQSFTDLIGLRMPYIGFTVIYVFQLQIEFKLMIFRSAVILGSAVTYLT